MPISSVAIRRTSFNEGGTPISQVILLDVLDHVPRDTERHGNIFDCHTASQLHGVLSPSLGEWIGEAHFDLPNDTAIAEVYAFSNSRYSIRNHSIRALSSQVSPQ